MADTATSTSASTSASNTFHCSVVTPERAVLESEARFVAFPAHDGEIGILRQRAPLLCRVGIGQLRVETAQGTETFFIAGGFAQMVDNRLTILTEQARRPAEIDRQAAAAALVSAREMKTTDERSAEERQRAIARAQAQLKMSESTGH